MLGGYATTMDSGPTYVRIEVPGFETTGFMILGEDIGLRTS